MSNLLIILGKAVVAIFLSLLLNYIYIATVSRLKKPTDKEIKDGLEIIWKSRTHGSHYQFNEMQDFISKGKSKNNTNSNHE